MVRCSAGIMFFCRSTPYRVESPPCAADAFSGAFTKTGFDRSSDFDVVFVKILDLAASSLTCSRRDSARGCSKFNIVCLSKVAVECRQ